MRMSAATASSNADGEQSAPANPNAGCGDQSSGKRAFDRLFKQQPRDPAGNFAERWEQVLDRLHRSDPCELQQFIRENIVLPKTDEG